MDSNMETPLYRAANRKRHDGTIVSAMSSFDPFTKRHRGTHWMIQALLDSGADVHCASKATGATAFDLVAYDGDVRSATLLARRGALHDGLPGSALASDDEMVNVDSLFMTGDPVSKKNPAFQVMEKKKKALESWARTKFVSKLDAGIADQIREMSIALRPVRGRTISCTVAPQNGLYHCTFHEHSSVAASVAIPVDSKGAYFEVTIGGVDVPWEADLWIGWLSSNEMTRVDDTHVRANGVGAVGADSWCIGGLNEINSGRRLFGCDNEEEDDDQCDEDLDDEDDGGWISSSEEESTNGNDEADNDEQDDDEEEEKWGKPWHPGDVIGVTACSHEDFIYLMFSHNGEWDETNSGVAFKFDAGDAPLELMPALAGDGGVSCAVNLGSAAFVHAPAATTEWSDGNVVIFKSFVEAAAARSELDKKKKKKKKEKEKKEKKEKIEKKPSKATTNTDNPKRGGKAREGKQPKKKQGGGRDLLGIPRIPGQHPKK